jgi:hypothetical protein
MRLRQRPNRQGPDSRQAGSTRQTGSRQTMSRQTGSRETGLGWWAGAGRRVGRAPQSAHHSGLEGTVGCTTFTKRVQGHRRLHDISWQAHTVQAYPTSHSRRRGTAVASRSAHRRRHPLLTRRLAGLLVLPGLSADDRHKSMYSGICCRS